MNIVPLNLCGSLNVNLYMGVKISYLHVLQNKNTGQYRMFLLACEYRSNMS